MTEARPAFATREVGLVAGLVGVLLVALSGRYGYHRDELYFLEAGHHLAWGYPDQPPLVPLLARIVSSIDGSSLVLLRLPSAVAAASVVLLAGLIARELGAERRGQVFASAATALDGVVLATGHLLSTTTFALLGWTALTLLLVKVLTRTSTWRTWAGVGLVAGVSMQSNPLVASFLVVLAVAVLVQRRDLLRGSGPYVAGVLAAGVIAPYVVWQARHGFPQVDVARGIANGDSGTSEPRWLFVPMQFLIVGPWLAPIWITGLRRVLRDERLRVLGTSYLGLAVVLIITGGKPYYLAGLYPLLLAAGAQPFLDSARRRVPAVLLVLSLPALVFVLPVLPVSQVDKVVGVNYDAGETVGWPAYVGQIAAAYRTMPSGTVILTDNYGEAGAVDRYGHERGLPGAYSGDLGYGAWGPPPEATSSVLAVGIDPSTLRETFTSVRSVGVLSNRWDLDNDENGVRLYACSGPKEPWTALWPRFKHLTVRPARSPPRPPRGRRRRWRAPRGRR